MSKPTSQLYYKSVFETIMPRIVAINTATIVFQYKILNNTLCINKLLFKFWKSEEESNSTPFSPMYWNQTLLEQLYSPCNHSFSFPVSTPQGAIFRYINTNIKTKLLINIPLLIKALRTAKNYLKINHVV